MKSEWIADFENNKIKITNSWFFGEKLFVNNELQDEQLNITACNLTGNLKNNVGEKLLIKANIYGFFRSNCSLFIDDKKVNLKQIK